MSANTEYGERTTTPSCRLDVATGVACDMAVLVVFFPDSVLALSKSVHFLAVVWLHLFVLRSRCAPNPSRFEENFDIYILWAPDIWAPAGSRYL